MRTLTTTPAEDGFYMPAEWDTHDGCWMGWPQRPDNWRLGGAPAREAFAAVATAIAETELVTVAASDRLFGAAVEALPPSVRVVEMTTDDAWLRDTGPTFVVDGAGGRRGVDWIFNAWGGEHGGLFADWSHDDRVAQKVLEVERAPRYRAPIVLEGGSINTDGEGTLLTTVECLLNPNRNPDLSKAEIEAVLCDYLGVEKIIWLPLGLSNDETDGHVDNLCCFAAPGVVLLAWTDDKHDPQHERSAAARRVLEDATDARGRSLDVRLLPLPGPLHMTEQEAAGIVPAPGTKRRHAGDRLAASYVNHYVANGRVVVPMLDPRTDEEALRTIADAHPERKVLGVPGREIALAGGNVHCITQQVPRP
jgi:agmatine deiminase